jgi:hypothetical protein
MAGDFFNNSIEGFEKLLAEITKVKKELIDLAKINQKAASSVNPASARAEDIQKLDVATSNLIKTEKELVKVTAEEVKFAKKIKDAKSAEGKVRAENRLILAEANKQAKEEAKISLGLSGAYAQQSKRLNDLRNKYKNLSLGTAKQREEAKKLLPAITKLDTKLKQIDKNVGQNFRSVGNYSGAISSLTPVLGTFGSKLNSIQMGLTSAKAGFLKLAKAQKGATMASKILSLAMRAIPILAIVGAITALISAFAGTQRGMDALTKVTRPLKALFDKLLGVVQELSFDAFDKLKEAIDDPIQAFKDLGQVIVDNVLNRFKALALFGPALAKVFSKNWKEGLKDMTDATVQLTTGITDATDKMSKFGDAIAEIVDESITQGLELDALIKRFEKLELATIIPLAKARLEYQKLREIANDQTKTDLQRIEALNEAEKQQRFITRNEQKLLDLRIAALKLELSFNNTLREEKKELALLEAEKLNSDAAAQKKINSLVSLRTGIELRFYKKRLAENKEFIDIIEKRDEAFKEDRLKSERELIGKIAEVNTDAIDAQDKEYAESLERRREEQLQFARDVTSQFGNELLERNKLLQESLKTEEGDIQTSITRQQQLAEKGLDNQLAFEKKKLAENLLEQKEAEKRAATIREAQRLADLFLTLKESESKVDPQGSTTRALQGVAESKAITETIKASVAAFKKGGLVEGDEQLIRINEEGQEFVIDAPTTAALGLDKKGSSMRDFKGMLSMHEMRREGLTKANKDKTYSKEMLNELKKFNNRPIQQVDVDGLGNVIETITDGSIKRVTKLKTRGRL